MKSHDGKTPSGEGSTSDGVQVLKGGTDFMRSNNIVNERNQNCPGKHHDDSLSCSLARPARETEKCSSSLRRQRGRENLTVPLRLCQAAVFASPGARFPGCLRSIDSSCCWNGRAAGGDQTLLHCWCSLGWSPS